MRTLRTLVLVAGLIVVTATSAAAAPPSTDTHTNAIASARWLAAQVNVQGFIESAPNTPNYSAMLEGILALESTGVGQAQVDAMLAYVGTHLDGATKLSGVDLPGSLAYLILDAEGRGLDPTSFGSPASDLVARLAATRRTGAPDIGLYGAQDPTYDGSFRQGLSLLALVAAGATPDGTAITWLEDQQCIDGLWTSYRADASVPCAAPDPNTFSGPDTNSTALALLGLDAVGADTPVTFGKAVLEDARTADGGWGFIASPSATTDANSTGVVLTALRTIDGVADLQGTAALLALQVGCDALAADRGAFAYQPDIDGTLSPNLFATVQAIPGIADVALPLDNVVFNAPTTDPCAPPPSSTTTTTATTTVASTTSSVAGQVSGNGLARTGADTATLSVLGAGLIGGGAALVLAARRRVRAS